MLNPFVLVRGCVAVSAWLVREVASGVAAGVAWHCAPTDPCVARPAEAGLVDAEAEREVLEPCACASCTWPDFPVADARPTAGLDRPIPPREWATSDLFTQAATLLHAFHRTSEYAITSEEFAFVEALHHRAADFRRIETE